MTDLTRRSLITTGGVAALGSSALMLAACAPAPLKPTPHAPSPAESSGASIQRPPAQIPVASPLPSGTQLTKVADIPVGGTAAVTVDGQDILLAQPAAGKVVAFSAICTHQGCMVSPAGGEFDCSCHGSRFEAADGAVLKGPAVRPLHPIAVSVADDGAVIIA
ncbi:Rieske Fe-S protein [Cryobacterium mesophilum]|uniref:Cytochrome bc1 complex Rieske iron-sulfur subunit n=1 Tax=Terrimesophilobacter mesophilus TaxID=433647 RepID=A0A4R8V7V6_9MICO|nr:Rieske (2Fe-2S) protein [Terrimesophilobacter mesophilus]MBB5632376.1 Rieske Fe-S protein [Terrimesophilobacter mesophilus]TFB79214.1 Rieske (2Fe-2S) protein [Terrimesophilobacter mesophilus]